jgi:sugar O-acyltransferase (sialic acid O-acetyltransferase NeuD family)
MSKARKLVIVGAGEFAEMAFEYASRQTPYEVVAFSVERSFIKATSLLGLPIVPFEEAERLYPPDDHDAFVSVSYSQLNRLRRRLYQDTKSKGYRLASLISPHAFVWPTARIGENAFIFEQNVIQHDVVIGDNVTLWSGNHIGHRSQIENHCYVASHVVVSGLTRIGSCCVLGVNSTIGDRINVAKDCFIAAGAVVTADTEPGRIYRGNPAVASKVGSYRYFKVPSPAD